MKEISYIYSQLWLAHTFKSSLNFKKSKHTHIWLSELKLIMIHKDVTKINIFQVVKEIRKYFVNYIFYSKNS